MRPSLWVSEINTRSCISFSILDGITNLSFDSAIKPDVAYGNEVIQQRALRKSLESIPELNEDRDNFIEYLKVIESLRIGNGLLNYVLIPGICEEKNPEQIDMRVAIEKEFAGSSNLNY